MSISIWDAKNNLAFNEPLEVNDRLFVDTAKARGDFSIKRLYKSLNVDNKDKLHKPPRKQYTLFTGHRGCGKSTELVRAAKYLHDPQRYYVIHLDCTKKLDPNNLRYSDVLLALANGLLNKLKDENAITIDQVHLTNLENWFKERIETHTKVKEFASEMQAGVKAKTGIPFLAQIFANLTNTFNIGSSYREELRQAFSNNFSEFATIFNQLLRVVEEQLQASNNLGHYILFTVDGTDRLDKNDADRFFIEDIHQLTLIESRFIYCAPIHLLHSSNQLTTTFDSPFRLPMLKIRDNCDQIIPENYAVMRDLIYKRVPKGLFDNETTVNYLICYSGGHPRDLLRLLTVAITYADEEIIDQMAAEKAVKQIANDYRRFIENKQYTLLVDIDNHPDAPDDYTSEETSQLLFNLVLLEYNDYFWKSHPLITTLSGYKKASNG